MMLWTSFNWLRIESSDALLWAQVLNHLSDYELPKELVMDGKGLEVSIVTEYGNGKAIKWG
jgi:hypothetical protein